MNSSASPLSHDVIGCAIEVHRGLGPGLLESAYAQCLAFEFAHRRIAFSREYPIPVHYKGVDLTCGYRVDFKVGSGLLVEVKSVGSLTPIHFAQAITYLKLARVEHALLINFNVRLLKNGIKSILLTHASKANADQSP